MKIYDRSLTNTGSAEAGKAAEVQKAEPGVGSNRPSLGSSSSDRVELSNTLSRLSRALSSFGSSRAARVQQLAAQYQSGNYRPDPAAIGKAMVSEALAAGGK